MAHQSHNVFPYSQFLLRHQVSATHIFSLRAPSEIRTHTERGLNPLSLPLDYRSIGADTRIRTEASGLEDVRAYR